jgi:hypothetical protein
MTFREDIEPALVKERLVFETHERSAQTLESTINEYTPASLARTITDVAEGLRKLAKESRARYEEIRRTLEEKYSPRADGER